MVGLINNLLRYCLKFHALKISTYFWVIVNVSLICSINGVLEELHDSQNKYLFCTVSEMACYVSSGSLNLTH